MACVVCAAAATVYCDNDKALLCKECDVRIHTSNAVAARHVRRVPCEGGCSKGATLFCHNDNAYMCEPCHSANPLAITHQTELVAPLAGTEQEPTRFEPQHVTAPCESVAQSAASPMAWFVDDEKPGMGTVFDAPMSMSPAGSEAVVPVMSAVVDDEFAAFGSAPATFKEIKDKLEFESLELDNGWLEMGFDFTDILSDAPSDVGLVPTFDAEAVDAIADALVPTFAEEFPAAEVAASQEAAVVEPSRKRAAEVFEEEPAAKVPAVTQQALLQAQQAFQVSAASMFFQAPPMLTPVAMPAPAPVAAPQQPKGSAAYNAALAAGANLTREQRVARYREKRKNRSFAKTIRYASRKAYAEIRPRIKGRFAKKDEIEAWKAAHGGEDAVVPEVLDGDF